MSGRAVACYYIGVLLLVTAPAYAGVVIDITELSGNVDIATSGTLNLTNAIFDPGANPLYFPGIIPGDPNWYIASATTLGENSPGLNWYALTSVQVPFGTDTNFYSPSTTTGTGFAIWGFGGGQPLVGVPLDYVSGSPISADMRFVGQTIAGLSLIPGTYTFTVPSDTIILSIGGTAGVPEPRTFALFGLGLAGLLASRWRRSVELRR
jgi:hypothetical protein